MSAPYTVVVSVEVAISPDAAFDAFTQEIDSWYRKDRHTLFDVERALELRFEPGVGGRLLEVYDRDRGQGRELGRVTIWEPGRRLGFTDNHRTDILVRFEATDSGTRVTIEHSGLDRVPPDMRAQVTRYGWSIVLPWFADYLVSA